MLRSGSIYLIATVFSQVISIIRLLLIPSMLLPAQLGNWNLLNIVLGYCANSHLGFLHGMNKIYPALKIKHFNSEALALRDSVFSVCLFLGFLAALGAFIFGYLRNPEYLSYASVLAIAIFFQALYTYFFCLLRAENKFQLVAIAVSTTAFVTTASIVTSMYFSTDRLMGAIYGLGIGQILSTMIIYKICSTRPKIIFNVTPLRKAIIEGFPILLVGLLDMFFLTADRWILSFHVESGQLGYYSFSIMICSVMTILSSVLSNLIYTRLVEMNAISGGRESSFLLFDTSLTILSYILIVVVMGIWTFSPFFIKQFMGRYEPSLPSLMVLAVGYLFLSLAGICSSFSIAQDNQIDLMIRQILSIIILLVFGIVIQNFSDNIALFAGGVSFALLIFFILFLDLSVRRTGDSRALVFVKVGRIITPLVIGYAALQISSFMIESSHHWTVMTEVAWLICKFLLGATLVTMAFYRLNREISRTVLLRLWHAKRR